MAGVLPEKKMGKRKEGRKKDPPQGKMEGQMGLDGRQLTTASGPHSG